MFREAATRKNRKENILKYVKGVLLTFRAVDLRVPLKPAGRTLSRLIAFKALEPGIPLQNKLP